MRQGRDLAQDVDHAFGYTIFGHERDIAVLDLDGDRHQHSAGRHLDEVGTHIERKDRAADQLVFADKAFKILELDRRRRKDLGSQFNAVKLLRLLRRCQADLCRGSRSRP